MKEKDFTSRIDLGKLQQAVENVRNEIRKIIVGQDEMVNLLITAILSDGHVLLEGVPGIAKTLTAKLIARTVSAGFSRIQFTPDLMPSDILGTNMFNVKKSEFEFKRGPVFSNIILIDEINRSPAKTQSALLEVMEERQATIDGKSYLMGRPFMIIATQNPIEHEGTYQLPEAQLDRFLFKIKIDYPSFDEDIQILTEFNDRKNQNDLRIIKPALKAKDIENYQTKVKSLHIDENLIRYIATIVHQTRNHHSLYLGGSPRASINIMTSAKALSAIKGRDFVTPDDIRTVAFPVLRHRILLTPEKEMEGASPDEIIRQIIKGIEVPR